MKENLSQSMDVFLTGKFKVFVLKGFWGTGKTDTLNFRYHISFTTKYITIFLVKIPLS